MRPKLIGKRAVGMEHLDTMVPSVSHGHNPAWADGDIKWILKLALTTSIRRKLIGKRAVGMEHLNTIGVMINRDNLALLVEVNARVMSTGAIRIIKHKRGHMLMSMRSRRQPRHRRRHHDGPNDNA